jgi:hypothetical protein
MNNYIQKMIDNIRNIVRLLSRRMLREVLKLKEWRSCKMINPKYLEHITCPWMDVDPPFTMREVAKTVFAQKLNL